MVTKVDTGNIGVVSGTASADNLYGLDGDDIVKGYGGNDALYGGEGDDDIGDTDLLSGDDDEGDDYMNGGGGNDRMNGGAGDDDMEGGTGDDEMNGGSGMDTMNGGSGMDQLLGGEDRDYLWGGKDADTFAFAHYGKDHWDFVKDFEKKTDAIALEKDAFSKLKFDGSGDLKKKFFHKGSEAEDKKDRLIYNEDKGKLYYDPTGSKQGKSDMELIAKLDKGTKLKYTDVEMFDI